MKPVYFICIIIVLIFFSHKNIVASIIPNGGEQIIIGQTFSITWDASYFEKTDKVNIFLWVHEKSRWEFIGDSPAPNSIYNWKVPNIIGNSFRIKILSALHSNKILLSESYFSIIIPKGENDNGNNSISEKIKVSPNPVNNLGYFSWVGNGISFRITNSNGNIIFKTPLANASAFNCDMSTFIQGLYFVEVNTDKNETLTGKFFIIR